MFDRAAVAMSCADLPSRFRPPKTVSGAPDISTMEIACRTYGRAGQLTFLGVEIARAGTNLSDPLTGATTNCSVRHEGAYKNPGPSYPQGEPLPGQNYITSSEEGVRLAQKMRVGPCIPVGIQQEKAEVGPTSGPTWRFPHLRNTRPVWQASPWWRLHRLRSACSTSRPASTRRTFGSPASSTRA